MGGRRSGSLSRNITYRRLDSQRKFHECKERFKGFSGPIGSGKSMALCQEAIRLSYVNPGRLGLIGAPTYRMLHDATLVTLIGALRANEIPFEWNRAENFLTISDTGSRILLRSVGEEDHLRGTNLAWFGIDELTYASEEAWIRLEGRLRDPAAHRLCGFAVWTPKGHDWVYRRFLSGSRSGYHAVIARPYENRHILDAVPDFYERLKNSYDESFFRQEVLGEYLATARSRVYAQFDRDLHLADVKLVHHQPLLWALDFNVDPMCSIVAQIDRDCLTVLDELVLRRASTEEACEAFREKYLPHPRGVIVYGDASGNRQQTSGASDYQVIRRYFNEHQFGGFEYRVPKSNPAVRDRIALTNARLRDASGTARIRIARHCAELVRDLEEVSYAGESSQIDKSRDPLRTHLSDALGYLLWEEFAPKQEIGEQSRRLI